MSFASVLRPRAEVVAEARLRATVDGVLSTRHREVGLAAVGPGQCARDG